IVHYLVDNDLAYTSSTPLDQFKDAHGDLDDVKLIDAFNDAAHPLVVTPNAPIPSDAVTTSASGLDPDISPANAYLQAVRVAKARGVDVGRVRDLVTRQTEGRDFGLLGEPRVNVLAINLDLDRALPMR